ncbi:DNA integrity scanning diadenylate cyclase DisA [Bacillus sp. PS06]|uniref:DNA integrity scanning diadenylate cyclase DisA n=1 Tax=Bacillus sp. PS06 TaxID=2764176 RepID=UPI0017848F9E|nr:DNA integrity scanning diadenylate cyclase DisA [Bacillus sp. PS06]MBD8070979.1 DNA integrity scanning protein DisA [Bacillus sp. PS06]
MDEIIHHEQSLAQILKFVAPGTPLREGIENVLSAKTGGLIVVGYNASMERIVDGGFRIDCKFSPASLYELAKMDGAIVLDNEGKNILISNAQLMPDPTTFSSETGMRHRTAERVARQTSSLVIAISQRRNVITLYKGDLRYVLKDIGVILTKGNQAIQTLDKYKSVLMQSITDLSVLEFENLVTIQEVLLVIHRIEMVVRIKSEILGYINELGTEGRLLRLQLRELLVSIEEEAAHIIKDYAKAELTEPYTILGQLQSLSNQELLDDSILLKLLGYSPNTNVDEIVCPRGYRVLHKIPRLPTHIIENVINHFNHLKHILTSSVEDLDVVEGIGEVRARKIKSGLMNIRRQLTIDRDV